MAAKFSCLVRFRDPQGQIHYADIKDANDLVGQKVSALKGSEQWNLEATSNTA
jgi:hypothetical protein